MSDSNSPFSLDGKTALVTGAGRGLGLEIARALALSGATVIVNGRDEASLEAAAQSIGKAGGTACPMVFDVTDYDAVRAALARIEDDFGGLDILVNNVGARDRRALFDFALEDVRALMETSRTGVNLELDDAGVAWISFDLPGEKINKLTTPVMERLRDLVDAALRRQARSLKEVLLEIQ